MKPRISVIIPVFNGARYLPTAIDNVLSQEIPSAEIIVINDGSSDDTDAVAARYAGQITYLSQQNRWPAAARNLGVAHANGEFLGFLDCDDCWSPDNLRVMIGAMEAKPTVDIVLGRIQEQRLDPESGSWVPNRSPTFSPSLVAMLTRKSTFEHVGLLDEAIRIGEDKDWFYRAREKGMTIECLEDHVALYHRRHSTNMTNDMEPPEHYLLTLMRESLQRRGVFKPRKP